MKSKEKEKSTFPKDTKFFTKKMLAETPVEQKKSYRVKWTERVAPTIDNWDDFDTLEGAENKFTEIAQNFYYVDLIEVVKTSKVIKKVYGSHV